MELTTVVDSVTFLYCLSLVYVLPPYKMKHVSDFFSFANAIVVGKIIASQSVQVLILGTINMLLYITKNFGDVIKDLEM